MENIKLKKISNSYKFWVIFYVALVITYVSLGYLFFF